ncbi:GDYXXLXY domain-containing protein [Pseudalkalibacillus sp. Hm43]|uniref:GDYXXLXY domain-containing protein n=1 Tax=Pseudalkalibacillus sp. Hm43 TaxID=3450742 RepID=UPI003F43E0D6
MNRKKLIYLLIVLQLVILGGIAGSHFMTLQTGERVTLETEPIDPKDLFHGDYVILNYKISRLPVSLWADEGEPDYNESVYVVLKESGEVYEASSIHNNRPDTDEGEVVLKAIVRGMMDHVGVIRLDYGIERYYVEEGTGRQIEEERPDRVAIRVAPWGQVTIEDLIYTSSE